MLAGGEGTVSTKVATPEMTATYHSEVERSQSVWWYLMLGVFLLAVGESFLAYGICRKTTASRNFTLGVAPKL